MATALQAEHAAECRLSDGFIDKLGIVTKKGHFGEGLRLRKASEDKGKWDMCNRAASTISWKESRGGCTAL